MAVAWCRVVVICELSLSMQAPAEVMYMEGQDCRPITLGKVTAESSNLRQFVRRLGA